MTDVVRYSPAMASAWNEFVAEARNPTLLHLRPYMDYHAQRFQDASLMFLNSKGKVVALLPANLCDGTVHSHQGLTYGGFVVSQSLHITQQQECLDMALSYYRDHLKANRLIIKPIPHIYCTSPCDEELYLIHRCGGILTQRNVSEALRLDQPPQMSTLRQRCVHKARKNGVRVNMVTAHEGWDAFHAMLSEVLLSRHSVTPVHTAEELWRLHIAFPNRIRLCGAFLQDRLIAGTVLYISPNVAHTQYLASSPAGQETGALDLVIETLIHDTDLSPCRYLDFGISNERDGSLNAGLAQQKEGFGARGVCYDTYTIDL